MDLRSEPWVLVQPPADGDRFYSSVWADLWAHIIDYPGSINDGQQCGVYLLEPTSWKGPLPQGMNRVIYGETTILGTLTRTAVFGSKDIPNMEKIQQGYQLMPLSAYLKQPAPAAAPLPDWPVWNEANMCSQRKEILPLRRRLVSPAPPWFGRHLCGRQSSLGTVHIWAAETSSAELSL